MGEVLRGPWGGSAREPVGRSDDGPEPDRISGRPSTAVAPASAVRPPAHRDPERNDPERDDPEQDGSEPGWAVPGVDADEPVPVEPSRSARRAQNVAIAALTRHDASEGEIRARLVAKGLDVDDVEAELDRLRRAGLLDDAAFAARQVERLRERKGLGDSAIRSALRGRLVPQDVVDAVLAEQIEDEDAAEQRLQQVADDQTRRLGSLPADVAERRLTAYLLRKGFGGSAVRTAARAALQSAGIR